jgi:hypothetical protein
VVVIEPVLGVITSTRLETKVPSAENVMVCVNALVVVMVVVPELIVVVMV